MRVAVRQHVVCRTTVMTLGAKVSFMIDIKNN
jgi:hypothetical protein